MLLLVRLLEQEWLLGNCGHGPAQATLYPTFQAIDGLRDVSLELGFFSVIRSVRSCPKARTVATTDSTEGKPFVDAAEWSVRFALAKRHFPVKLYLVLPHNCNKPMSAVSVKQGETGCR